MQAQFLMSTSRSLKSSKGHNAVFKLSIFTNDSINKSTLEQHLYQNFRKMRTETVWKSFCLFKGQGIEHSRGSCGNLLVEKIVQGKVAN